ncbi:DEHA2C15796p [Debaryomyces hansenii CBS767]|uniref:DEHA2C15796p n=1 Tax=Debaryomyces hansenii (strain ATCC 36239 / CBS 767 / BCRC 21394 / JCM 1990 / NBRC 0083 / IGC 2968) TaxID=284592 RepID=Q6BTU6_DEBHA|nr:DEHA2C15796p [Debaryomyces hansenii CBS767]CAG86455.1 DEHA2C15796p [Debaryomyces hansenii CBS767]|eukprot:XP_458373.1 DEHA2C15796p [Debaryomyces hansenii CBS767]
MFMAKRAFTAPFMRFPQISRSIINSTRNLFIQTMETPNEHALKFLPSMQIMKENETREFLSGREAACSPLALKLFSIDGIKSIMFGSNFITIEKANEDLHWSLLKPEIFSILTEFLNNGTPILNEESELTDDMEISEDDDETVTMIKELIFTRIRPAIQDDGGDIEFVSFAEDNGTVYLRLKGACRSCDSSSVTLKNGIESMLKYYIEEVTTVEQVNDEDTTEIVEKFKSEDIHLKPSPRDDPPSL